MISVTFCKFIIWQADLVVRITVVTVVMMMIPIKQLGKRSSLNHRHRWSDFQCWPTSSSHLCPIYCILLDHIKKSKWSQGIAIIAFSFITACSKDCPPWRTQNNLGKAQVLGGKGWPQTEVSPLLASCPLPACPSTTPTLHWPHRPPPRNPRVVAAVAAVAGSASSVDQWESSVEPASTNESGRG